MKQTVKENIANAASTMSGAAIGVVAATVITNPAQASASTSEIPVNTEVPVVDGPVKPETPVTPVEPVKPVTPEPEVTVYGFERIDNPDGSQMDVAVVSVDGQLQVYADVDLDGQADLAGVDINLDGQISEDEIIPVADQGIAMQPFFEVANPGQTYYAQNDEIGPDYINDANVDSYLG